MQCTCTYSCTCTCVLAHTGWLSECSADERYNNKMCSSLHQINFVYLLLRGCNRFRPIHWVMLGSIKAVVPPRVSIYVVLHLQPQQFLTWKKDRTLISSGQFRAILIFTMEHNIKTKTTTTKSKINETKSKNRGEQKHCPLNTNSYNMNRWPPQQKTFIKVCIKPRYICHSFTVTQYKIAIMAYTFSESECARKRSIISLMMVESRVNLSLLV